MRNRWYDPQTGRFLSQDPIGLAGGVNLYAYAGNNPASYSDPFGLKADSLEIIGEKLKAEVAALRKAEPNVDAVYKVLENSPQHFVQISTAEVLPADDSYNKPGIFPGFSWDNKFLFVPDELAQAAAGRAGSWISPAASASKGVPPAIVAYHEAIHLQGIAEHGDPYAHGSPAFSKENGVHARQGVPCFPGSGACSRDNQ
jgi:hypothetical protein